MFGNSTLLLMLVIVIVAFVAIILGLRFALHGPQKRRDTGTPGRDTPKD